MYLNGCIAVKISPINIKLDDFFYLDGLILVDQQYLVPFGFKSGHASTRLAGRWAYYN